MVTHFKRKQKREGVPRLMIWFGAVVLAAAVIFLVVANVKMYAKRQALNMEVKSLQNKIEATKKENTKFEQGISEANNDQYIEKVAREELDLQKPGERVISFVQPQAAKAEVGVDSKNALEHWLGWVGGWFKK